MVFVRSLLETIGKPPISMLIFRSISVSIQILADSNFKIIFFISDIGFLRESVLRLRFSNSFLHIFSSWVIISSTEVNGAWWARLSCLCLLLCKSSWMGKVPKYFRKMPVKYFWFLEPLPRRTISLLPVPWIKTFSARYELVPLFTLQTSPSRTPVFFFSSSFTSFFF